MQKQKRFVLTFSMVCMASFVSSPSADAAADYQTSVSVGAEYTSGDYGTSTKTKIWYFPVTLKYESDINAVWLTVPYVSVAGTGNVVAATGMRGMRRTTTRVTSETNSGIGDITLAGSHLISETSSPWRIYLTGKIKFGTADENKNLGTGEDDYAVQLDVEKSYNSNSVFGSVGYKILGDPPGTNYDNVFYGSVGLSHALDSARAVGAEYFAQEAALSGTDGQSELTLFLSNRLDRKTKLTGYFIKGLADGSPDWGLGVLLKLTR